MFDSATMAVEMREGQLGVYAVESLIATDTSGKETNFQGDVGLEFLSIGDAIAWAISKTQLSRDAITVFLNDDEI